MKLTCRSLSKQFFSKCSEQMYNNVNSFGRYFSFCPRLIRRSRSCLILFVYLTGFNENLNGFFLRTINTAYCSTAWHNENNYDWSYWITEKVRSNLSLLFFLDFCWIFSSHNIWFIKNCFTYLCEHFPFCDVNINVINLGKKMISY